MDGPIQANSKRRDTSMRKIACALTGAALALALMGNPAQAARNVGYIHATNPVLKTITIGPMNGQGGVVYQVAPTTVLRGFNGERLTVADLPSLADGMSIERVNVSYEVGVGSSGAVLHSLVLHEFDD